jgi:tetratricopeptide (TPR) repeat protein
MLLASVAWSQDAVYFYKQGLQSSLANRRIQYFSKALQLNPNLAEAYEKRGFHYYYQRRFDRAIYDYTKVIELKPNEPEPYRMRGQAYLKKGNLASAIDSLNRAIELDPKMAGAYGLRAEAYRLTGMAEKAVQDATTAIHLRGNERTTANAYATRAKAYQQLGEIKLADSDFNRSFELDPRYAVIRYLASTASLESVRRMGLFGLVALLFVAIFQLGLQAPRKGRHR